MCFIHDGWSAAVWEQEDRRAEVRKRCDDCRGPIAVGESYTWVFAREYDYCRHCDQEWPPESDECPSSDGEPHAFGEEMEVKVCCRCQSARSAIREVEEEEGCVGSEAEPSFGALWNDLADSGEFDRYVAEIAERRPSLVWSGWLDRRATPPPADVLCDLGDEPGMRGVWDARDWPQSDFELGGEG